MEAGGAFYIARNITGMVDFIPLDRQAYIKLLPMVPGTVFEMNKNNYCE
ncbi:hypothetical protein AGMMS50293_19580 [Spirochaetia bacterium]|nr:hypothetical protein AGMMS50293_19580 [Spirochaetia bacterium]